MGPRGLHKKVRGIVAEAEGVEPQAAAHTSRRSKKICLPLSEVGRSARGVGVEGQRVVLTEAGPGPYRGSLVPVVHRMGKTRDPICCASAEAWIMTAELKLVVDLDANAVEAYLQGESFI